MATAEDSIKALEARVAKLEGIISGIGAAITGKSGGKEIANDRDLDSKYGDPVIRFDPDDWNGESCAGKRLSQCSAEYLDAFAIYKDDSADRNECKPEKKKYAPYERKDAARARGWARRIRKGWTPPANAREPISGDGFDDGGFDNAPSFDTGGGLGETPSFGSDDEIPF